MATTVELRSPSMAARAIHWATALLVLSAWVVGSTMEEFPHSAGRDLATQLHYSLGVLVLGFAALPVSWRALAPPPPAEGPAWQRLGAPAMYLALIGLTIGVPLTGLLDRWPAAGR